MKKILIPYIILIFILIGCSSSKNDDNEPKILREIANNISSDSSNYTIEKLKVQTLSGTNYVITFTNQFSLQVYVYSNQEDAIADINGLSNGGSTYTRSINGTTRYSSIDWNDVPHFYQYKNTIILYLGKNQDILEQLFNKFGEQIACE